MSSTRLVPSLNGTASDVRALVPTRKRKPHPLYMTVEEVAETLDLSIRTVWKWSGCGRLPAPIRRGGKWTRWERTKIDAFVRTGVVEE